jgi:hypothetical protein
MVKIFFEKLYKLIADKILNYYSDLPNVGKSKVNSRQVTVQSNTIQSTLPQYSKGIWYFFLYESNSGAYFCKVKVRTENKYCKPISSPELTLYPHNAIVLRNLEKVRLESEGKFSWTYESLLHTIRTFENKFGYPPNQMNGYLAWDNLSNFQQEFAIIRCSKPNLDRQQIAQEAIRKISFGKHRIRLGYNEFHIYINSFGDVTLADGTLLQEVPCGDIYVSVKSS